MRSPHDQRRCTSCNTLISAYERFCVPCLGRERKRVLAKAGPKEWRPITIELPAPLDTRVSADDYVYYRALGPITPAERVAFVQQAKAPKAPDPPKPAFAIGQRVRVVNLQARNFNSMTGTIEAPWNGAFGSGWLVGFDDGVRAAWYPERNLEHVEST